MPHILLEFSDNIIETNEVIDVLAELHELLNKTGLFQRDDLKSRTICYEEYLIGDDNPDNAFIHLTVSILSGRTLEIRKQLSKDLLAFLETQFSASLEQLICSITVDISEIEAKTYSRSP